MFLARFLRFVPSFIVAIGLTSLAAAQERTVVPNTPITLVMPSGFVPIEGQAGLLDPNSAAVISAVQVSNELLEELDDEADFQELVAELGIQGASSAETVMVGEHSYFLVTAEVEVAGLPAKMWLAVPDRVATFVLSFVQAEMPDLKPVLDREGVLAILATVEGGPALSFDELVAQLGFALVPTEPFAFNSVMGPMVALNTVEDRASHLGAPQILITRPPFVAGTPIEAVAATALEAAGEHRVSERKDTTLAGASGRRLFGDINEHGIAKTFVMYAAYVDERPLLFYASGDSKKMGSEMVQIIDGIAMSVVGLKD